MMRKYCDIAVNLMDKIYRGKNYKGKPTDTDLDLVLLRSKLFNVDKLIIPGTDFFSIFAALALCLHMSSKSLPIYLSNESEFIQVNSRKLNISVEDIIQSYIGMDLYGIIQHNYPGFIDKTYPNSINSLLVHNPSTTTNTEYNTKIKHLFENMLYITLGVHPANSNIFIRKEIRKPKAGKSSLIKQVNVSFNNSIEFSKLYNQCYQLLNIYQSTLLSKEFQPYIVALGEMGLDYSELELCSKEDQYLSFYLQLYLASFYSDYPLFLHSRSTKFDFIVFLCLAYGINLLPLFHSPTITHSNTNANQLNTKANFYSLFIDELISNIQNASYHCPFYFKSIGNACMESHNLNAADDFIHVVKHMIHFTGYSKKYNILYDTNKKLGTVNELEKMNSSDFSFNSLGFPVLTNKCVLHSCTDSIEEIYLLLKYIPNSYIGITGASLRDRCYIKKILHLVPRNRLVVETDSPWCALQPNHYGYHLVESDQKNKSCDTVNLHQLECTDTPPECSGVTQFNSNFYSGYEIKSKDQFEYGKLMKKRNEPCMLHLNIIALYRTLVDILTNDIHPTLAHTDYTSPFANTADYQLPFLAVNNTTIITYECFCDILVSNTKEVFPRAFL